MIGTVDAGISKLTTSLGSKPVALSSNGKHSADVALEVLDDDNSNFVLLTFRFVLWLVNRELF